MSEEELFAALKCGKEGLDDVQVKERLTEFGPNQLEQTSSHNLFWIFFRQFHNALIYILLASTGLALFLGKWIDAAVVFSVVLLNTFIGFVQEYRSSKTIEALLKMLPQESRVKRNGVILSIPSKELVPGDLVLLQAGDRIAADLRLLSVHNLGCDESTLTGESMPVIKREHPVSEDTPLPDRKSMAYNGTLVTAGSASGIVVATAVKTEFGKISQLLKQLRPVVTPLERTLQQIAHGITAAVFLMGLLLFIVALVRGYPVVDALLASIALAVAAIPEGLPATITIAASIGVRRMAAKNAMIRHLLAVETLGSTTVICTDKTGTLTQNEMTVQSIWSENEKEILEGAVLCNDATLEEGDPTEIALIEAGAKKGIEQNALNKEWPRLDLIPFESERRIMATLHRTPSGQKIIYLKGALEEVLKRSSSLVGINQEMERMAAQGMRVLAVAKKELSPDATSLEEEDIKEGFLLLGIVGMRDPPRIGVKEAITACQSAGITVKMITGDHPITAAVIGKELNLSPGRVVLGEEIDQAQGETLQKLVRENHIFSRALPEHKLKITEALQGQGHVVAMTGDGVNDAPALKRADIGIAMGITGSAVAKEASDMVLADDNFASIEAAVEEGRRVYDNLLKSIVFMFPVNLAQALVVLFAVLFFPIDRGVILMPILPVQILWVNLVVAVALALPLAFEAKEPDLMKRPPRKAEAPLLSGFIILRTISVALLMALGTIALFFWQYKKGGAITEAQTMAVTTLMFFQLFYLFNCRSLRYSLFTIGFFSNPYLLLGIGFVLLAQLAFVTLPFMQLLFHSSSLSGSSWLISIGVGILILPIIALEKRLKRV